MSNPNIKLLHNIIDTHFVKLDTLYKTLDSVNNNDDTFYIYTTGIANSGSKEVINAWRDCRYKNIIQQIIKQIPKKFTKIIIEHYDPILFTNTYTIKDYINEIFKVQDNSSMYNYKIQTTQTFIQEGFDHTKINTTQYYIILDFAHLFYYCYNKSNNEYYMITLEDFQDRKYLEENFKNKIKKNCIYIDFPNKEGCDRLCENIKYFKYDTNQKITSYIELYFKACEESDLEEINVIRDVEDIKKQINKKIFVNQIYPYIRLKVKDNNIKSTLDYVDTLQDVLYIEFFNKLFESELNNSKLFNLKEYKTFQLFEQYLKHNNLEK
jgi:hypothetical protein